MTKSTKLLTAFLAIVLSIAFTGCKEDDPQPALEYKTEGYIKGKLTGISKDGSYTFNDDFNYTEYSTLVGGPSTYRINADGTYNVTLYRSDFAEYGSAAISFKLSNATDTTPENIDISFTYSKELSDKFVTFSIDSDADNTQAITDFTFDATTGKAKGKFSISGLENSTGKSATATGDFDVTTKKVVQ
ncbi:MAG: hypothetical protein DI538_04325 [Azospira oryzae]|nr:MAG: hypothetical protein DI538_04325 [Azospira oryzae]